MKSAFSVKSRFCTSWLLPLMLCRMGLVMFSFKQIIDRLKLVPLNQESVEERVAAFRNFSDEVSKESLQNCFPPFQNWKLNFLIVCVMCVFVCSHVYGHVCGYVWKPSDDGCLPQLLSTLYTEADLGDVGYKLWGIRHAPCGYTSILKYNLTYADNKRIQPDSRVNQNFVSQRTHCMNSQNTRELKLNPF